MNNTTRLNSLPHELHLQIRSYLTTQEHAQIALTCKLYYQLYFPASSSLYTLPNKCHRRIRSYLDEESCILVGLACKRLQSLYFPKPSKPLEEYSLWAMVDRQWLDRENPVLDRWLSRIKLARYLTGWVNGVTCEARRRAGVPMPSRNALVKFCVGCARSKRRSKGWKSGEECLSRIDRMDRWEDYGSDCTEWFLDRWCFWGDVEYAIRRGSFCSECLPRWRGLESDYMGDYWTPTPCPWPREAEQ